MESDYNDQMQEQTISNEIKQLTSALVNYSAQSQSTETEKINSVEPHILKLRRWQRLINQAFDNAINTFETQVCMNCRFVHHFG